MAVVDKNVENVIKQLASRAEFGYSKYGVTTERDDVDLLGWLQHAQEEAMDLAVYLQRLKEDVAEFIEWKKNSYNDRSGVSS